MFHSFIIFYLFCTFVSGLLPLEIKGNRFIKPSTTEGEEGEVFFIKGVDYQPGGSSAYEDDGDSDVLTNASICFRDAYVFQQLGINTIRVYTINPSLNHDECLTILNNAGIYLLLDLSSSSESIYRSDIEASYNYDLLYRFFSVVDAFKDYPNVLGFFVGNEVINDDTSASEDPPYIRAVQRDVKNYIQNNANRTIPVGYSAADVTSLREATFEYLECNIDGDENDLSRSDFFGLNSYEWCSGISDWSTSGYSDINSTFANSSIPIFFSEYGCNTDSPRTFTEVSEGLYGGLIDTLSGGLVYEYSQETSNYGLVTIGSSNGSITELTDFNNLQEQFLKSDIPDILESEVQESTIIECDSSLIEKSYSGFDSNFTLPAVPSGVENMILYGANNTNIGHLIDIDAQTSNYTIYYSNGTEISDPTVVFSADDEIDSLSSSISSAGSDSSTSSASSSGSSSTTSSSSSSTKNAASSNNSPQIGLFGLLAIVITYLM
ncbi:hypothetical protein PACTADRAFT_45823 [Pachysolen tannophilus NRRL Y-2460]|uniref:1,3-beta-glucanosyltransferase n=1 Tax=Pachysolen tannophilus NRRL Y-2460 TaxID=669874 RepID=A0A1E4TPA9_PACTA|nr:hypothetical protein PACTADRAFT_45823 [Pachysolen tannophilus NRRL Y-2460]